MRNSKAYEIKAVASDKTASGFFVNDQIMQIFECEDELRQSARPALESLQERGLQLELVSGDQDSAVSKFTKQLGIQWSKVSSALKPEDKARLVDETSIFVGDGLNDHLALRKASLSLGLTGSAESALQNADAYLVEKNLRILPALIDAAHKLCGVVRLNQRISILYNILRSSLVYLGYVGPVLCAIVMPISSATVILIAQRSRYLKKPASS